MRSIKDCTWNILCGRFHSTLMIQSPVLDSLWTCQEVWHPNVFSLMTEWFSPGSDQSCLPCSDFPWIVLSNILNRIATKVGVFLFPCNFKCNYFSLLWTFCQYSYVEVLLKSLVYLCNWIKVSDHLVNLQGKISANFGGENCLKITHITSQWKIILMNYLCSHLSLLGRGTEGEASFQIF